MPPGGTRGVPQVPAPASQAAPSGLKTIGNYTMLETVGQGTFGEVMLGVERHTRESVAIKILEKDKITDDDARQRLVNEIAILHRVQHANLVQLLEVIDEGDRIYLVTEYVGGGELFAHIVQRGRLEEAEAVKLFAQMVAAVDSCHRQHVIHRDLKPENVLLDAAGDIKVIDFGLGTILSYGDEVLTVACGSPHYAAPEMLLGGGYLGQRADMWSLGVCLYAMMCGCLPFDEPEMDVLYDRIIAGEYDFSPAPNLSHACKDLICGLLCSSPDQRLTARQVLNHKWMRTAGSVPPQSLAVGLLGAVVDPACRQLVRRMEVEYGMPAKDVVEALRRGERSALTSPYWLLRQRELRKGTIQRYTPHMPRPPPPRLPTQRRRPVPSNIRKAAALLPELTEKERGGAGGVPALPMGMMGLGFGGKDGQQTKESRRGSGGGRYDDSKGGSSIVARARDEAPVFVHASGALSDRTDRDGPQRRGRELEKGPVRRAGPGGGGSTRSGAQFTTQYELHGGGIVPRADASGIERHRAAAAPGLGVRGHSKPGAGPPLGSLGPPSAHVLKARGAEKPTPYGAPTSHPFGAGGRY